MSTDTTSNIPAPSVTDTWGSALYWITGTVLWVAVFVSTYLIFGNSRPAAPVEQTSSPDGMKVTPTTGGLIIKPALAPGLEKVPAYIEDFTLTNRDGKTITRDDLKGQPWVCNFIFTKCVESCPMITGKMRELAEKLEGQKVRFVSFTIDPKNDTPEQLSTYAEIHRADKDNWYFLTGDRSKIFDIIQNNFLSLIEERMDAPKGYEFAHSNRFFHIDADGKIAGSYLGTDDTQLAILAKVIEGKTKTPADHEFFHTRKKADANQDDPHGVSPVTEKMPDRNNNVTPAWVSKLPLVNTSLNAFAGFLLCLGMLVIKAGKQETHKKIMLSAFGVSIAFLGCYLLYHFSLHYFTGEGSRKYTGTGNLRTLYFSILISHVFLAAFVPVLAIITIHKGIRRNWISHHRWAKITFPLWLYVSITGVIVYIMLYHG